MSSRQTVAVLVITKNEETHITECLESVKWADEIILVDAQSTDETVAIARKFTDRIFIRPWPGFGLQKNFGLEQAGADWILILDADERVSVELSKEIQETLSMALDDTAAYRVPRRNFFYGKWVQWGGAYPDYQIRLVQRGKAQYNDVAVHENLLVDGSIATLSGHLDHYTERQITDHFKKFNLYTTLAASEKGKVQNSVSWYHVVCNPFIIFFKTYVLKKGYRDGTRGIIFAVFASMYTFVKYTKLFESHVGEK
ncbi:MAG: glycosyl transferase [Nitrospirales bacterium]|nr:MAG: glycosyl transferase [Nitrospirales bacterium]